MKLRSQPTYRPLFMLIMALLIIGLVVLFSASSVESFNNFGNTSHYFTHQLLYGALGGLLAMAILSKIDYHVWQKYIPHIIVASFIALALVKVSGIGWSSGGASRWIHVGPLFFQPAEIAKIAMIFYIAAWIDKKGDSLHDFYFGLLPSLFVIGIFAFLILWQPDLGTMLVVVLTSMAMLFLGGMKWRHVFWAIASGAMLLWGFVKTAPYRARRITTFLDPSVDPKGISYQINQALLAIGAGGWFGYGYGLSRQKHNYLPEAMGDSIFAVMAEELGYIRVLLILGVFLAFAWQGYKVAQAAPDTFGKLVAAGITSAIILQALINVGAMVGVLPLTGIPLPFFSYGSSSLLVTLGSMGILLNISRQAQLEK
jgi:cell division protein FtsW